MGGQRSWSIVVGGRRSGSSVAGSSCRSVHSIVIVHRGRLPVVKNGQDRMSRLIALGNLFELSIVPR